MLRDASSSACVIFVMTSLLLSVGCKEQSAKNDGKSTADQAVAVTPAQEYNPHDAPLTEQQKAQLKEDTKQFSAAVAKIKEFRDATEAETKDGIPANPYKAHQALDQVDLVLQWLPQIGRDSGIAKEHWEQINTTASDLRTLFEKVHQNIDDQKHPDFAAVAAEIDQQLARLEAIAPLPAASGSDGSGG